MGEASPTEAERVVGIAVVNAGSNEIRDADGVETVRVYALARRQAAHPWN